MSSKRPPAFMLLHVLLIVTLTSIALGMGTYASTRSITIQRRLAMWVNDDNVTQDILRRVHRDASRSSAAEVHRDEGETLVLRRHKGEAVSYTHLTLPTIYSV